MCAHAPVTHNWGVFVGQCYLTDKAPGSASGTKLLWHMGIVPSLLCLGLGLNPFWLLRNELWWNEGGLRVFGFVVVAVTLIVCENRAWKVITPQKIR